MKKLLISIALILVFYGCSKDESLNTAQRNVVSEDGSISLKELLVLINIKTNDSTYLVVESIDSVKMFVNNTFWSMRSSSIIDTTKIDKIVEGNRFITDKKLSYLLISEQEQNDSTFLTAGDFAAYLNSLLQLKPGEYACFIESFQIKFNDQSIKRYYPFQYQTFKVEANNQTAFVGEFNFLID